MKKEHLKQIAFIVAHNIYQKTLFCDNECQRKFEV